MRFLGNCTGVFTTKHGDTCIGFILNSPGAIEQANEVPKGTCEIEVNRVRRDRTLNQNAMLWRLIGDISIAEYGKRTAETDSIIYKHLLKRAGAKTDAFMIKKEALPEFIRRTGDIFRAHDITFEHTNKDGIEWVLVHVYYGSSGMNTEEFGRLIDEALAYAADVGLDAELWREQFK